MRRALVVAEVALAVMLVIGAGLLLRTVLNLSRVDAGFDRVASRDVLRRGCRARRTRSRSRSRRSITRCSSGSRRRRRPGVAGMTGLPPLRQVNANDTTIEGYMAPPDGPFENVDYYQNVTGDYFQTMGIPVVEGRAFQPTDATARSSVLINQTMARTFYRGPESDRPARQAVGRAEREDSVVHDRRRRRRT